MKSRWRRAAMERLVETGIYLVSFSAVVLVFVIFAFVAREAWPVIYQRADAAGAALAIKPGEETKADPRALARYLEVSPDRIRSMDAETLRFLLQNKTDENASHENKSEGVSSPASFTRMLRPFAWDENGESAYIWQPESTVPKFNIVPLLAGTLKCTLIAILFAAPLALLAAVYVSQLAPLWMRQIVKPLVEMLAGIPSVVLGFFALMVLASWMQNFLGVSSRLNALVAGVALGLAVIPIIFTIAEDALRAVPQTYKDASLALGATPFESIVRVVAPAALPGMFAALVLGFGRAMGETMIVLMASGNASILSVSPADSARTLTATIAAELAETVRGGRHYQVLFFLGAILFLLTFLTNLSGGWIISRMRKRMAGQ